MLVVKTPKNSAPDILPTRNYAIDALRFIAVCFVIYIHIFAINTGFVYSESLSWNTADVLFGLARLAVPVFFAISGWYIFSKNRTEQIAKLQKQIPKLIKILIAATFGTGAILWIMSKFNLLAGPLEFFPNVKTLIEMFALGRSPTIAPLWFLVSLIIVEVIFWIVSRKFKRDDWLLVPAFIFFGLNLAFGAYRSVTGAPELPTLPINELWVMGFAWFCIGYFLAKYFRDTPELIKQKTVVTFLVVTGLLYLYEYILHTSGAPFTFGPYNYHAVFIFTPFITAGILLLAARSKVNNKIVRTLAYLGKNYSLGVFIIHLVVMQPLNAVMVKFGILQAYPSLKLIFTITSTIVISFTLTALYYKVKAQLPHTISKIRSIKSTESDS